VLEKKGIEKNIWTNEEVTGEKRAELHSENLQSVYACYSPYITRMIESSRMSWLKHVAHVMQ
jgi:hypothetical protein